MEIAERFDDADFVDFTDFGAIAVVRRSDVMGVVTSNGAPVVLMRDGTKIQLMRQFGLAKILKHLKGKSAITQ